MKKNKKLVTIDRRAPVTIALDHAIKLGLITPEGVKFWKKELTGLVCETAKKFTGLATVAAVRHAHETTLGIISLALLSSTDGDRSPQKLAVCLVKQGLKPLVMQAITMVKDLSAIPAYESIGDKPSQGSPRAYLLKFAEDHQQGFDSYCRTQYDRKENETSYKLAIWLIKKFFGNIDSWCAENIESELKKGSGTGIIPDHVINNYLFRYCCGLSTNKKMVLKKPDFLKVRKLYEEDTKKWLREVKKKYDALTEEIPEELHSALFYNKRDLFQRLLAKGPPKISPTVKVLNPYGDLQPYNIPVFV